MDNRKLAAGTLAAAVVTILAFVAAQYGLDVPAGVEGAAATIVAAVVGYFKS